MAVKYDLPVKDIEEIINSQFHYVSKIMAKGDFETIKLPYFGKFTVNENRVKHINRLKNESTRRSNNDKG